MADKPAAWLLGGALLLVATILIDLRFWVWSWQTVGIAMIDHIALVAIGLPTVVLLVAASLAQRRTSSAKNHDGPTWPWLLSYPGIATIVAAVAAIGIAAIVIMLWLAAGAPAETQPALRIDAIKYGLGLFAAAGAAAALLLSIRRQQHTEHAQAYTELDAAERRVTDLYTKAVEQLGHAEAAVRLGGLYALERVAQNNISQRQTVINVICAYLRMPYAPPPPAQAHAAESAQRHPVTDLPLNPPKVAQPGEVRDPQQELQVRKTAQRIIEGHLTAPAEVGLEGRAIPSTPDPAMWFWPGMDLDLTGATLADWNLARGRVHYATFARATFSGGARFRGAIFSSDALFEGAIFSSGALFDGAIFSSNALFEGAIFSSGVSFDGAAFNGGTSFNGAAFTGHAAFRGAAFTGHALFDGAAFTGDAWFDGGTISGGAAFRGATFTGDASFGAVIFSRHATFHGANFIGSVSFNGAAFAGGAAFRGATFVGNASFGEATFSSESRQRGLTGSCVLLRDDRLDVWPPDWAIQPSSPEGFGDLVFSEPSQTGHQ